MDNVNHPPHYTNHKSGVECITITQHMGFNLGNALKYIWRCDEKKNAIEDLKKATWYIAKELEKRQAETVGTISEPVKAPTALPTVEEPYSFQMDPGRLCREYMSLLDYLPLGEKLSVPIETINNPEWKHHKTTSFSLEHDGIIAILTRIKND